MICPVRKAIKEEIDPLEKYKDNLARNKASRRTIFINPNSAIQSLLIISLRRNALK